MPSTMNPATRIFEDADADTEQRPLRPAKSHNRTPSVGRFLRGRRKENEPSKNRTRTPSDETPLGERQINSPPQARRVPIHDDDKRPTMHKKSKSSISIKSMAKDKSDESTKTASHKPKKSKSVTSLAALLKKRSKKDLKEAAKRDQENITPPSTANIDVVRSPIWAQFATQPLEDQGGRLHFPESRRTVQEEINLYTPREEPSVLRNLTNKPPQLTEKPPQRPYLEHRSSRSSIFEEEMDKPSQEVPKEMCSTVEDKPKPKTAQQQPEKKVSRVLDVISTLNMRSRQQAPPVQKESTEQKPMSEEEINAALEILLDARNIASNMRDQMRGLDKNVKLKLIQNQRGGSGDSSASSQMAPTISNDKRQSRPTTRDGEEEKETKRSRSRSRPRSRAFTLTKRDHSTTRSPTKKPKDGEVSSRKTRPKSEDLTAQARSLSRSLKSSTSISSLFSLAKPDTATSPEDFIHYLTEIRTPSLIEIGKMHKLRILLRNESITWTSTFITAGGMTAVVSLLHAIITLEWREEHDDNLLHETLLCLKALCTTDLALAKLEDIAPTLFPALLGMLFDKERRGPSEFTTRGVIVALIFAHLSAAVQRGPEARAARAREIFQLMKDPEPEDEKKPIGFIEVMHTSRPYRVWAKEVTNVSKEVFWIFLHSLNVVPLPKISPTPITTDYATTHFPPPRAPHPAAPYVGGVEWDATTYIASHLDLLNGLLACLPTAAERNTTREEFQASGWERLMGHSLRTCKEKFYGAVHDGLRTWVAAAKEDGWAVEEVRAGPRRENRREVRGAPKVDAGILGGIGVAVGAEGEGKGGWI